MLIEFSVGNFRSFKEPVVFSLVATGIAARSEPIATLSRNNVFQAPNAPALLKSAAVYGANASGKSNLIKAIQFMRIFVRTNGRMQSTDKIPIEPFLLNNETQQSPSFFEIVFHLNDRCYRYGFEADRQMVHREWLYHKRAKETKLFVREKDSYEISRQFKGARGLNERTNSNALFLSVSDQFNVQIANDIMQWFGTVGVISGLDDTSYKPFTVEQVSRKSALGERVVAFVRELDLGIMDIQASLRLSLMSLFQSNFHKIFDPFFFLRKI